MSALSASDQTAGLREAGLVPWSVTALGTGGPRLLGQPPSTARGTGQRQGAPKAEEAGRLGGESAHSRGGRFQISRCGDESPPAPAPTPGLQFVCGEWPWQNPNRRGRNRGASPQSLANYRPGTGPGRPGLLRARLSLAPASPASPSGDGA